MQAVARLCVALSLSCLALWASTGCGAPGPSTASSTPKTAAGPTAAEPTAAATGLFPDSGFQQVSLARFALRLELPDASAWRQGTGPGWARLDHARSRSRLELNLTRAERLVRPEECEARARLEHPELPRPAEGEALDRQRLGIPHGFLSYATLSVKDAAPAELEGHVTVFGAAVSRCFALHFVTRVAGAGAENEVARRLGVVVERVLPSLELRAIDDRVSPAPFQR